MLVCSVVNVLLLSSCHVAITMMTYRVFTLWVCCCYCLVMLLWGVYMVVVVVDVMLSCSCQVVGVLLCWCLDVVE